MNGPDAPFPGMAAAFEAHTGKSWTDPAWRRDAAMWAAAWKAALLHNAELWGAEPIGEASLSNEGFGVSADGEKRKKL